MRAVPEPTPREKQDTFKTALLYKQGLRKANKIITSSRSWYLSVKKNYSTSPKRRLFGR
jgi:hypothetical protein